MKILGDYSFYWGVLLGSEAPTEKWAFKTQRLIFGAGGKIK
jgi:hypothetical protein